MAAEDFSTREFPMTDRNFDQICRIAMQRTGISLTPHKKEMVYSRLARRIRSLGLENFTVYCEMLATGETAEMNEFVNAITTNLTSFFREKHHFSFLRRVVDADWARRNQRGEALRIWSAGCSSGEEPYSIAMTLCEAGVTPDWNLRILATDLDSNMLDTARAGIYPQERVEQMNPALLKKYFLRDRDAGSASGMVRVKQSVRDMITFNRLNLMEEWPMRGRFDVIFCRNVVIYFTKDTQRVLFDRYAELLKDQSHVFIGHSESLSGVSDRFENLGNTIYRKIA
jgi:chemotaxis protein methyltransferase CheR